MAEQKEMETRSLLNLVELPFELWIAYFWASFYVKE